MKPLEFIFALLAKFINFKAGRITQLEEQAHAWEAEQAKKDGFLSKFIKKSEEWYIQVGLAIFFLFAVKGITRWLQGGEELEIEPDDEEIGGGSTRRLHVNR